MSKKPAKKTAKTAEKQTGKTEKGDVNGGEGARLPLFYKDPVVLEKTTHAGFELAPLDGFAFAAGTNSVALNAVEFPLAARHYPIVFIGEDKLSALAIVGLRNEENLFVDSKGNWSQGAYVPAYVRRYPFIFLQNEDASRFTLCVDRASNRVRKGKKNPLFIDGEMSETTKQALEFCTAYQQQAVNTQTLLAALNDAGLIVPNAGKFTLADGEVLSLRDFKVIDEAKLNALDDETFVSLRKQGALAAAYCQLVSMNAWNDLVRLAGQ